MGASPSSPIASTAPGAPLAAAQERFRVHGMGTEPVEPDWPPLTAAEVSSVVSALPPLTTAADPDIELTSSSPRPFSATALVGARSATGEPLLLVVKRHHASVRSATSLGEEHAFAAHLGHRGVRVARPLAVVEAPEAAVPGSPAPRVGTRVTGSGGSGDEHGREGWTYEVLLALDGADLYRDRLSWTPYLEAGHAHDAGRALALLHEASTGYAAPARRPAPLMCSDEVTSSDDLVAAIARFAAGRPGLSSYLSTRHWQQDVREHLAPWHDALRRAGGADAVLWCHGDWHPSNLLWSAAGYAASVTGVIDFGLCNLASARYDLATAIERSLVAWLDPPARRGARLDQLRELLAGYASLRPLSGDALDGLAALLPLVHVEYALSEVAYFHGVVDSPPNADLAYEDYLLGHADWFAGRAGSELLAAVRGAAEG